MLLLVLGLAGADAAARCPGPDLALQPLAHGLWWLPAAADGDADDINRGHVSHLLVAEDGARLWLVGSGPTPAFGRWLRCRLRERFGRGPTDVVSAWPRPEAVLGVAGLGPVRHWAHADVARAMRRHCPGCVVRLRARLGSAAGDLGDDPVRVPDRLVRGASGALGPWRWHLATRGPGWPVTRWQFAGADVHFAPGLLWGGGVPDGRDAHVQTLAATSEALAASPAPRWLGEQGPVLDGTAPAAQARYWALLLAAVRAAQARGDTETGQPPPIDGIGPREARDPRHALNWQRAWRQLEESPSVPQRSLR